MNTQKHCNRSQETLNLLLKLSSPTTFDEDIWWHNKLFDRSKETIRLANLTIVKMQSILESKNITDSKKMSIEENIRIQNEKIKSKKKFINWINWKIL